MNFQKGFPRRVTAVLAIIQTILAAAIIGLEFGSFSNDVAHGTIWAGFWCGVVFIITFLMMFCTTCCCRGVCCATYVLILNILSGLLACVIIYFDAYFIGNLCKCYLGDNLCCALHDISSFNSAYGNIARNCSVINLNGLQTAVDYCYLSPPTGKLVYLKAQIAGAVAMLIACGIYVVVYVIACFGMCCRHEKNKS